MEGQTDPTDAARALSEINRQREQVIRRAMRAAFPVWYWWTTAVLAVALTACVESGHGAVPWIGVAVFTVGSLVTSVPVSRAARATPLHRSLDSPKRETLIGLAAFMAVLLAVALATGLSLKAAGVPHPATIAAAVAGVVFAAGGQMAMSYLTAFLVRRSRSQG